MAIGSHDNPLELGGADSFRPRQCSAVWQSPPEGWREQLAATLSRTSGHHLPGFFFRADDIGAGGRAFEALCRLFRHHQVPVALAVVPAWLSDVRREQLLRAAPLEEPLWGWHQHGWRHVNWQRTGKKSEFGEHRPHDKQLRDIQQGQEKLREIFGTHLLEVFTPPWNRLSSSTVRVLKELHFKGVSMTGVLPRNLRPPAGLKNLRIHLDLHTRKAPPETPDFQFMLDELGHLLSRREPIGIMIHHQRMNLFAFEFLDELLRLLKHQKRARFLSFRDILKGNDEV